MIYVAAQEEGIGMLGAGFAYFFFGLCFGRGANFTPGRDRASGRILDPVKVGQPNQVRNEIDRKMSASFEVGDKSLVNDITQIIRFVCGASSADRIQLVWRRRKKCENKWPGLGLICYTFIR